MQLTGIHHLTAVTADAARNHDFYTRTLGMRLVKKTVNQDDASAYHLFYADGEATPGSDITFFDWPVTPEQRGTHSISRTGLRVAGKETLRWWKERFEKESVTHGDVVDRDGRKTLDFEDFEGQRLSLVEDGGVGEAHPWNGSPVPAEHQIRGRGYTTLTVPALEPTHQVLSEALGLRHDRSYPVAGAAPDLVHVYRIGGGGAHAEVHVVVRPGLSRSRHGAGGVHHVALRVPDGEGVGDWVARLDDFGYGNSGIVDRHYFTSVYVREPNHILFELATDGPGFDVDGPLDGERLSLPPFLEPRRAEIEARLKPLTSTKLAHA